MMVTETEVFERALNIFGIEKQLIKCVEELSELQKELCKQALGQGNKDKVIEEMADVEIMMEQMKIGLSIGFYELSNAKSKKICRLSGWLGLIPEKEKQSDAETELRQCQNCCYFSMTREELNKLANDPCETCDTAYRNWKPKEELV